MLVGIFPLFTGAGFVMFGPVAYFLAVFLVITVITNADVETHNFHVPSLGIATDLVSGRTTDVWVKTDTTGTSQFYCSVHSTQNADGTWTGMTGTLVVG